MHRRECERRRAGSASGLRWRESATALLAATSQHLHAAGVAHTAQEAMNTPPVPPFGLIGPLYLGISSSNCGKVCGAHAGRANSEHNLYQIMCVGAALRAHLAFATIRGREANRPPHIALRRVAATASTSPLVIQSGRPKFDCVKSRFPQSGISQWRVG